MHILIVDDDAVSLLILQATLLKAGHQVVTAKDGTEAIEACGRQYFPLLIPDWLMPGTDGLGLCRHVRSAAREKYTHVMLLTGLGGKSNYLEAMDAGADDFITKPFDKDLLMARIQVAERVVKLQTEVKRLSGLLPMCCYCKKIRDDKDYWGQVEEYIASHTEATFSHGICPDCYREHIGPRLARLKRNEPKDPAAAA
jgi:DNA-binding response OmpR family regulator